MKNVYFFIAFIAVGLFFNGCQKTEHKEMAPQLKIVVKNASAAVVNGAEVKLFSNVTDFQQDTNIINTAVTNELGAVLFTDLEEIQYYFTAEFEGKTNHFGVAATTEPLEAGYVVVVETIIE